MKSIRQIKLPKLPRPGLVAVAGILSVLIFILIIAGLTLLYDAKSKKLDPVTGIFVDSVAETVLNNEANPSESDTVSESGASNVNKNDVLADGVLTSQFRTSALLTTYSLDSYGNAAAVASGKALLNASTHTVSQPIMGFGVLSPSSGPGQYDWSTLDKRIGPSGVTSLSSEVGLHANAVPGWMRNTPDFGNDTAGRLYLEYAPLPEYYDDFGDLVAATVQRYPNIKYVQVWSEMKGFWDASKNRWNHEGYTQMYNQVWTKVKAVRPDVKVGGPYPALTTSSKSGRGYNSTVLKGSWGWADKRDMDVITYWLQNKTGADFINLDIRNHHTYDDRTQGVPALVSQFEENNKFIDTVKWIRSLDNATYPGATTMPIWFAEWYSRWDTPDPSKGISAQTNQGTEAQRNAVMADGLIKMVKSGAARAFLWGPQGEAGTNGWMHPLGLFTNTRVAGGGQATPFYATQKAIKDHFSAGVGITNDTSSNVNIELLTSSSKLLMVNKTGVSQTTTVLGGSFVLGAYEVKLADVPSSPPPPANPPPTSTGGIDSGDGSGQTGEQGGSSGDGNQIIDPPVVANDPIIETPLSDLSNGDVAKTEVYVNGKLLLTSNGLLTEFERSKLSVGDQNLTYKVYYKDGSVETVSQKVTVPVPPSVLQKIENAILRPFAEMPTHLIPLVLVALAVNSVGIGTALANLRVVQDGFALLVRFRPHLHNPF